MLDFLQQTDYYQKLIEILASHLQNSERNSATSEKDYTDLPWLTGVHGPSLAYLLAALAKDSPETSFLVVLPSHQEAEKVAQDLPSYGFDGAQFFPDLQNSIYDGVSPSRRVVAERMSCLHSLMDAKRTVAITSTKALMHKVLPKPILETAFLTVRVGDEIDPDSIVETLVHGGYQRTDLVEVKGDFARRGDILDVYPLVFDEPIRFEFFGDEVDVIRVFDPTSQRSVKELETVMLSPMREVLITDEAIGSWRSQARLLIENSKSTKFRNEIEEITERLVNGINLDGFEALLPILYPCANDFAQYLSRKIVTLLFEPTWMAREAERIVEGANGLYEKRKALDQFMMPPSQMFVPFETVMSRLQPTLKISSSPLSEARSEEPFDFSMQPLGLYRGNYQVIIDQIKEWTDAGYFVNIFSETPKQAARMQGILYDRGLPDSRTTVRVGSISEGFLNKSLKIAVLSEHEIFGRERRSPHRHSTFKEGAPILSLIDLKEGDYIVHVSHGIGIYEEMRRLEIDGKPQDFLVLKYAAGDILYVPTYQIDLVQKYIGGGGEETRGPRLDKMGGISWQRRKARVKESIELMADELLSLYAIRESGEGHPFSTDVPWQVEFEAMFPYEETPDQLKAIEEVKVDMERVRPMDRLVCGDVGYGKTEVALRSAFKAVMDGKQVAVLVPTTILALQHYNTFVERFSPFPIQIEMMTRFRTVKELATVKRGLAEGAVDIVIGTHSLLSDNVKVHDLGLLVVDEEHRFGVKHKEKIKQLKKTVDVLTLTATPIPRTLHMSLVGIRDFSVINTPPENRLPIKTYVLEYDSAVIQDAILREMERGGQIFFVHNRVESIASIAKSIRELVPQARVAVGHGQMSERQLEKVMMDFVQYKYDVLVCTMIIESGLDIPNVNTIIINRADALGLAQLYQLRGRVGRAQQQAYGFLFYPQGRAITEGAQKRLRVIEEFTELGSGFKIALRDLDIRGTGNILGAEQHGHIATVGYEMYCKLLNETMQSLSGEEVEESVETRINLPVEAYLPDKYVPDSRQKVSLYKKIAGLETAADRTDLEAEISDRYGRIPEPVEMLLEIAELKHLSKELGIEIIAADDEQIKITFDDAKSQVDPTRLIKLIRQDGHLRLMPPARLMADVQGLAGKPLVLAVKAILKRLIEK
ncbi:MAG: transcription-repair coupling factor [Candidatus Poribacteria bacterium]|nr:transcription-repair coupling factor [Candidatus Poribacteria bacterium]